MLPPAGIFGCRDENAPATAIAGRAEQAPFNAIILAAAAPQVPKPLIEQLAPGGKLVVPVGPEGGLQELLVVTKQRDGAVKRETVIPVAFVPMTGEIRQRTKPAE